LGKGVGGWIWFKYCAYIYVNGKIKLVEIVPGMGGGEIKENGGEGEFKYGIFDTL
jgi:hypothetical protein